MTPARPTYTSFIVVLCALFSTGCDMKNEQPKVSSDIAAFRNLVDMNLGVETARWEVFATPEYTGGVPGPTDFVTLVAEVTPPDRKAEQSHGTGSIWIAPEAARPWLSEEFRSLLTKHGNTSVDLSSMLNCRKLDGKLKKTGKPIEGLICTRAEKSLIYLTLSDYTTS